MSIKNPSNDMERRLAIIPARGGSKRVPRKNIRSLLDKPLIAYTIDAALESDLFERVIVSTDSEEIARISTTAGAEVPFLRGNELADDVTPVSLATVDALERLDPAGTQYVHVVQLMANCPLRTARDICSSYDQFVATGSASQISLTKFGWQNPWWAMRLSEDFELKALFESQVTQRSQDLPDLFCPTGAVWWARTDVLRRERTFHISGRTGWEIPWYRGIDIDTEDDWLMAETLLRMSKGEATSRAV
jgi:CMP-N-acetylneuraminic acid synthetase